MYQRDYSGIKSDGQLYEYERSGEGEIPDSAEKTEVKNEKGLSKKLRSLGTDDILLLAIGLLLLTDKEEGNDILLPLILMLMLF